MGNTDEDYIGNYAKHLLENVTFTGVYTEQKQISEIDLTCQAIQIHKSETQFISDLQTVRQRLQAFYSHDYWIGFGDDPANEILVENLNVMRGTYLFLVEAVEFRENEILLKLKVVKRVYDIWTAWYFCLAVMLVLWIFFTFFYRISYKVTKKIFLCAYALGKEIVSSIQEWLVPKT